MALYYVAYTKNICSKYKAHIRSNVTIFLIINSFICFIIPFILAYNSNGIWIKEHSFAEQPLIKFKYQYLIVFEDTVDTSTSIMCSSFEYVQKSPLYSDVCSLLKVYEMDENKDGKNDKMHMVLEVTNVSSNYIGAIYLFLIFDYKLYSECILEMEVITTKSYIFARPIGRLDIVSELITDVRIPINCNVRSIKQENFSLNVLLSNFTKKQDIINEIISYYATKPVNVNIKNLHYKRKLKTEIAKNEPLIVTADINYPEQRIRYKARFWQLIKWAWIQYFAIMALFLLISRKIKKFVFQNRILQTIEERPYDEL